MAILLEKNAGSNVGCVYSHFQKFDFEKEKRRVLI
jgi:hypothetical protein